MRRLKCKYQMQYKINKVSHSVLSNVVVWGSMKWLFYMKGGIHTIKSLRWWILWKTSNKVKFHEWQYCAKIDVQFRSMVSKKHVKNCKCFPIMSLFIATVDWIFCWNHSSRSLFMMTRWTERGQWTILREGPKPMNRSKHPSIHPSIHRVYFFTGPAQKSMNLERAMSGICDLT